jgi:hypothetical protein|tara:strand:+ start:31467 stop:31784 length:318 start_codon:yes stop_codon:yes gene_type:complete
MSGLLVQPSKRGSAALRAFNKLLKCTDTSAGATGYLFKGQLWGKCQEVVTADMYVLADTDTFDSGLIVGENFPSIKTLDQGQELTSGDGFVHDKGMVFIANRSAD